MTVPALLRHHGISIPRYVTIDGSIVFDDVTVTAGGHEHPVLGPVTPVSPHRFHSGDEAPDNATEDTPWWTNPDIIERHRDTMACSFPGFVELFTDDDSVPPAWGGELDTGRGRFEIAVLGRHDAGLPQVIPLGKKRFGKQRGRYWIESPHLYTNGNLCVASRDDWNPEAHTVATAVGWTAHWLAAYTEWRMTDRWPIDGYTRHVAAE